MSRLGRYRMLARKALTRPPSQVARRIGRELWVQAARPWVRLRPSVLTDAAVLAAVGCSSVEDLPLALARAPFLPLSGESLAGLREGFMRRYPGAIPATIAAADRIVLHEFDLLGSGPRALGAALPWRADFKTGAEWPRRYASDLDYEGLTATSDVKVPWELSRFQHATLLGQAWLFTGREAYRREFVAQFDDWDRDNPLGYSVNWVCAMDVAIRLHNLQWGYHYLFGPETPAPSAFAMRFARALYLHGEFIEQHLEVSDVNGNHYLADAVGLVSAGVWLRGSRAGERWLRLGRRMLREEIFRQVHSDGVDFEQSTAYHRLVTEMFLTGFLLLRRAGEDVEPAAWDRLARMFDYIAAYTNVEGRAPLIGDADDGRMQKLALRDMNDHQYLLSAGAQLFNSADLAAAAPSFSEEAYWLLGTEAASAFDGLARDAVRRSAAFPDGGMYVLRAPGAHAIVDCAEVGMRGLGGHGHNDILSFELCLDGRAFVTDCGAFLYTANPEERDRFRSTAFHNTVQVDGEELNRFITPRDLWRLHDDARPLDVRWSEGPQGAVVAAGHSGYERLEDPVRHRRTCALAADGRVFAIRDHLRGRAAHRYIWRFHLAPGLEARVETDGLVVVESARERRFLRRIGGDGTLPAVEDAWVSASYGRRVPSQAVTWSCTAAGEISVQWVFGIGEPAPDVEARALALLDIE